MSKFLPTRGFKWKDPKNGDLNQCSSDSLKGCVLEVGLKYFKQWRELHDYLSAPDEIQSVIMAQIICGI